MFPSAFCYRQFDSARLPFFRVMQVKEWESGHRVHGHLVSTRLPAEEHAVPHGLAYSAKESQLCKDDQSPVTANVTTSATPKLIMSMRKLVGSVYRLHNLQDLCCLSCRPERWWQRIKRKKGKKTLTVSCRAAVKPTNSQRWTLSLCFLQAITGTRLNLTAAAEDK